MEAQFRGSLHLHILVHIQNAPEIDVNTDAEVTNFIHRCITCSFDLSDIPRVTISDADRLLPQRVQLHRHRQTCKKQRTKASNAGLDSLFALCPKP